jgi:hypothetical protein
MLRQFKISLVALTGIVVVVSACEAPSNRPSSAPTAETPTTNSSPSAADSESTATPRSQPFSPNAPESEATATSAETRDAYDPIALDEFAPAETLTGEQPKAVALSAFGVEGAEGNFSQEVTVNYPQPDRAIAILTQTGLADDSVAGMRYRIELVPADSADAQWQVTWAGRQYQCQEGRGHQDWSTELCL